MFIANTRVDREIIALILAAVVGIVVGVFTSESVAIPVALVVFALVLIWGQVDIEPPSWMVKFAHQANPDAARRTQAFCRLIQLSVAGVWDFAYENAGEAVEQYWPLRIVARGVRILIALSGVLCLLLSVLIIAGLLIFGEFGLAGLYAAGIGGSLLAFVILYVMVVAGLPRLAEACPIRLKQGRNADAV
jgi:hypothetical protein